MKRSSAWALLAILLAAPWTLACQPSGGGAPAAGQGGSTVAVGLRVRAELLAKLGVDGLRIEVAADEGRVRLAGEVKQRATAELAEEVAKQVSGVTSVENSIRVSGAEASSFEKAVGEAEQEVRDAALETKVRLALVDRLGSDGFRIGTDAASGVMSLEFPAELERERRREAKAIAEKVAGVTKVIVLDKR